jgi:hypothetical protein
LLIGDFFGRRKQFTRGYHRIFGPIIISSVQRSVRGEHAPTGSVLYGSVGRAAEPAGMCTQGGAGHVRGPVATQAAF